MTIKDPPPYVENDDRTIFIPRPGGRGPSRTNQSVESAPSYYQSQQARQIMAGVNPLASAASPLIAIAAKLRTSLAQHNVASLRSKILAEVKEFENSVRTAGFETDIAHTAKFILCAYIDEVVLNTVWGINSLWAEQSLLSTLYSETRGGEVFFVVLDRLLKDPNPNIDLLELMFICISLGYKGRYGVLDQGNEKLDELRSIAYERIRQKRGEIPQELSPHWQGQSSSKKTLRTIVPLWVVAAVAGVLLMAVYLGFSIILSESAAPVKETLDRLATTQITHKADN